MKGLKLMLFGIAFLLFGLSFITMNAIAIGCGTFGLLLAFAGFVRKEKDEEQKLP